MDVAKFFSPRDEWVIAANFVVLNGLRVGYERGVQHRLVFDLASDFIGLLDDSNDGAALSSARLLAKLFERFVESFDLFLGSHSKKLRQRDALSCSPCMAILSFFGLR